MNLKGENMRKYSRIFIAIVLAFCLTSCGFSNFIKQLPDTITIHGREYKRAFIDELYPVDDVVDFDEGVEVGNVLYYKYSRATFDCYISYDSKGRANIYFASEQFDEALSFYNDAENFTFVCVVGNIHDESKQQVFKLQNMDPSMFNKLHEFSVKNGYSPFSSTKDESEIKRVPIGDINSWKSEEIHFYKESKNGEFCTSRGYTYRLHDGKLFLLYYYDWADKEAPVMLLEEVPSEINDYFCSFLKSMQIK